MSSEQLDYTVKLMEDKSWEVWTPDMNGACIGSGATKDLAIKDARLKLESTAKAMSQRERSGMSDKYKIDKQWFQSRAPAEEGLEIGAASELPAPTGSVLVEVERMTAGDRFVAYGSLWTYLGHNGDPQWATARKHSNESVALKERGYGYIGDGLCSFDRKERVEFVAPNAAGEPQPPENQKR